MILDVCFSKGGDGADFDCFCLLQDAFPREAVAQGDGDELHGFLWRQQERSRSDDGKQNESCCEFSQRRFEGTLMVLDIF